MTNAIRVKGTREKTGALVVAVQTKTGYRYQPTNLKGVWNGQTFTIPFADDMTADDVARKVSTAIRSLK